MGWLQVYSGRLGAIVVDLCYFALLGFASIVLMNAMAVLIIVFVKVSEYEKQLVIKSNIIKRQIKGRYVIGNYSYSIVQNKHRRYIHIILDFFKPCMSLFKSLRLLNLEFFPWATDFFKFYVYSFWQISMPQCARTDLNKRFLPKPMTTTGWKGTP